MPSFKKLLKHSLHFYKAHWKSLVMVLLPTEITIFVVALILRFGLTPARFFWVAVLAIVCTVAAALLKVWKMLLISSGAIIASDIEGGRKEKVEITYKKIARNILPMIWIGFLQILFACAIMSLLIIVFLIVFLLPFIVLAFLGRAFPSVVSFIGSNGSVISLTMFGLIFCGFVITSAFAISSIWFAFNAFLLEGRRGLDALAVSAMLMYKKRWQVLWRIAAICIVSILPLLLILGPVYIAILEEAKPKLLIGLMLYTQYHVMPAWPEVSAYLFVWRSLLTAVACLLSVSIFTTLNFLLWKDVKATAPVFEEARYVKTRKWIKISVWTGLLLIIVWPIIIVLMGVASVFVR